MSVQSEWVDLKVDDGTEMRAWISRPKEQSPTRGLLVFQEAFGFLAISPELFHRTAPGFEGSYTDFPSVMPHLQAISEKGLDADVRAAFGWLERAGLAGNVAAVGYCLGGRVAFVANSAVPLKAAASYYGGRIPPLLGRAPRLSGPMLFFWGGLDHHVPETERQAVAKSVGGASKPFVDVTFSDADHGFFNDARSSYHPAAAAQAWTLTNAFFDTYCPR